MGQKKTIVVIGAGGFVGSQIVRAAIESDSYYVLQALRGYPLEEMCSKADIVIHAANPAKRFAAEKNPILDFEETVEKTAKLFEFAYGKKFVLISSISCRTQLDTHYGRHRRACELIALTVDSLVVRLGPMFGGGRKQDSLHDILCGRKVYVSGETQYAYVDVEWAARKVVELIDDKTGLTELGAKNSIKLKDIASYFDSKSEFEGKIDDQIPEGYTDGPDANDVYEYAKKEL